MMNNITNGKEFNLNDQEILTILLKIIKKIIQVKNITEEKHILRIFGVI